MRHKVTHIISCPEYCIGGDEVGGNTSQIGDSHYKGEQFLVKRGTTAKTQLSTKDCHFIVMGVTLLSSEPLMRVLVLKGMREEGAVEVGFDEFAEVYEKRETRTTQLKTVDLEKCFQVDRSAHTSVKTYLASFGGAKRVP